MVRTRYLTLVSLAALAVATVAEARLTRVRIASVTPAPARPGIQPYEIVRGTFSGEVDPRDRHNAIITDIGFAALNRRHRVGYSATFEIARPIDLSKASGVLFYDVPNRGHGAALPDPDGHIRVISGWQGNIAPGPALQTVTVPVAHGQGGLAIRGALLTRMTNIPATAKSVVIGGAYSRTAQHPLPIALDTTRARLVKAVRGAAPVRVAPGAWAFADCSVTPFPGKPDPARLCLRDGFDPEAAYTIVYEVKDPLVLGLGFAATRDLVSFLRSGKPDDAGTPNPAGRAVRWTVASGTSQSGNFLRSFTTLGFNADEGGRRVFDGINPNIAARQIVLNLRFGQPEGAADPDEPGSEGTLWWGRYDDAARGLGVTSLLDRCTASNTCPKVVETFGAAEFWGLRASPGLVGTDAKADIPLPANVRRYYFPGVTHGGSNGTGFPVAGDSVPGPCVLRGNPNPSSDSLRVAQKMLVAWVKRGTPPPPSRYPTIARGELVAPNAAAMGWPRIPGAPVPDGKLNPFDDYDFGPQLRRRDLSGVVTLLPPAVRRILPSRVPRVNGDGNETAGVPSVQLQVPLGTYTGWNVMATGHDKGGNCGFNGGFIPFARTRAERFATHDPRPSLEERYGNHAGFVMKIRAAVARQRAAGWLLADDAARIVAAAERSNVLR
ncbi:alpha/beta hydrolase domain-containing protein [Sphingomonas oligophenolica]|uniref:Alpha/beta hydrolase domain-containing protein n=1 Tax=Sphingomonas oligophenolica TaxID=301154 RepID=A0ABU9Y0J8_9SPHN